MRGSRKRSIETETEPEIPFQLPDEPIICMCCSRSIYRGRRECVRLHCEHEFCLDCAKYFADEQNKQRYNIMSCPICLEELLEYEAVHIDPVIQKEMENRSLEPFITGSRPVECPKCGIVFLLDQGQETHTTKDMKGENLSEEALDCIRKNRCRCVKCGTIFCANCKFWPYHDSYTCEEQQLVNDEIICRFCGEPVIGGRKMKISRRVCHRSECKRTLEKACEHVCECGHPCAGLKGETEHFGCPDCQYEPPCICNEDITKLPSIRLQCGHGMHLECAQTLLAGGSDKGKIVFPKCTKNNCQEIPVHPALPESRKWVDLKAQLEPLIKQQAENEHLDREKNHVNNPNDRDFYKKPLEYARSIFQFYMCSSCNKPYYGGHAECGDEESPKDAEYLCSRCQRKTGSDICSKHGEAGMVFKCMFCCNPTVFKCWGDTAYFCSECHKRPQTVVEQKEYPKCDGTCPFAPHPPNGQRIRFGYCASCEAEKEHDKKKK